MKRFLNYACWLFKDELPEVARMKKNWFILCCNSFVLGMSFAITYPSLHQFVTTPTSITATKDIRPGLGLSETFYSWSVSVYPIGEVVTGIIFSISAKYTSIKSLCCVDSLLLTLGGVFYGSAVNGPMVLLARICQGSFIGGLSLIVRVYLGETTNIAMKLKNEDTKKSQLKNSVFIIVFGISAVSVGLGPALTPIVAQFPSIDPFRWSGWVVATAGLLMLVINSLYFVERPSDINRKGTNFSLRKMQPAVPLYVSTTIYHS
jgi:MFS family permease